MEKTKILPGDLLVSKGALKLNSTLPEVGLKDVSSNGSWLEQKQSQAALEARKQLIEVERIEKSGVLSHAEWREDLMLAEVTQKAGGYWQYLGHNMGKRLFLNPEEALFLMETNCLLLKYNDVKVSLQQAYALMLRSKISLLQYKIYASLSRLGYRVFRHHVQPEIVVKEYKKKLNITTEFEKGMDNQNSGNYSDIPGNDSVIITEEKTVDKTDELDNNATENKMVCKPQSSTAAQDISSNTDANDLEKSTTLEDIDEEMIISEQATTPESLKKDEIKLNKFKNSKYIKYKINKLRTRKFKTKEFNSGPNNYFKNIPEFTKGPVVGVMAPDRLYLPEKVTLRTSTYYLNIEKIRTKSVDSEEVSTTPTSPNGPANPGFPNMNHFRHPSPHSYRGNNVADFFNFRFSSQPNFRNFPFWRPQTSFNYFAFNMTFQRPFVYPQFGPRVMFNPFLQNLPNFNGSGNSNNNNRANRKKKTRDVIKREHYASIEKLATFVRNSILESTLSDHYVAKLNNLIQTYNTRYKTRLRLSANFTVIIDENIVETIDVDDEEEPTVKRVKKAESPDAFNNNLQRLTRLAFQLKNLEKNNEATSRHRRIFSHLLKKFNSSYSVDYYINDSFEVIDRNDLTKLSSSDSESVAQTHSKVTKKKLKNPFSILKKLSEKPKEEDFPSTSANTEQPYIYSDLTVSTFKKDWLPGISDFGRAEIVTKDFATEVIDTRREEFLFDFMKIQPDKLKNWLDIKISFLQCLQETCELFQYDEGIETLGLKSLVQPDELNDASLVLKKLRIFENNKMIDEDTNLAVDFDVYFRDVQNFKKSNKPLPHFRVICIKESSSMPSGIDIASLHSKYKDNVTIVFAVAGINSISYLQVNPVDLSAFVSNNDNTD